MASANSRWIVVDDLDNRIEYAGGWQQRSSKDFAQLGNFGQPFGTTVHTLSSGTAVLSFKFNGSDGAILGTSANAEVGALVDPHWDCFLDGTKIPSENATLSLRNNQKFCEWTNTPFGEHTIAINITSVNYPFHFDHILYAPSLSGTSPQELVSIAYVDRIFKFDSSWKEVNSIGMMTAERGANLTVDFNGTSFSWYGMGLSGYPPASSNASYQVDGGESVTFVLKDLGPAGIPNSRFNELIFEITDLEPGPHTVSVVYEGDSTVRPLTLTSIVVHNQQGDVNQQVGTTLNGRVPLSAIVGAVLGAFFFILAIILVLFWYRFHRKRPYQHVQKKGARQEIDPFYVDVSTYKTPADFSEEFEPLTGASRSSSMVGLDKHLVDPFAIPERPSTPPRRPHSRYTRDVERHPPSRTPSFDILLSPPPPNVRSSGIVAVRLRSDSIS
ncbi:hypothetical protein BJ165DRAFT_1531679 [Panaeolus papilionaceus]|nr:hypothetical protein BJ165DRAFT_1531679 [Panaeolus papilionaceus]